MGRPCADGCTGTRHTGGVSDLDPPAPTAGERSRAWAYRVSDRLGRLSKIYLGPAQFGGFRPEGTTVRPLSDKPCPACGLPLAAHDLVHSDTGRQRFYCPRRGPVTDGTATDGAATDAS